MDDLKTRLAQCRLCDQRFLATRTSHRPRPLVWFRPSATVLIASQAPGARAHASGIPFDDPSGERLRDWMGVGRDTFYDQDRIAIVPMGFCFPGYDKNGSDIPPPAICAKTWRKEVLDALPNIKVKLVVGGAALNWHFKNKAPVKDRVRDWRDHAPDVYPLPHPSWRNNAFLRQQPHFETDLLPHLKATLAKVLA